MKKWVKLGIVWSFLAFVVWAAKREPSERPAVPPHKEKPEDNLSLKFLSWKTGGFGTIALVKLEIANHNAYDVKDIAVLCIFRAKSGTQLTQSIKTVYDVFPKDKKVVADIDFGFIDRQSNSAGCSILSAQQKL